MINTNSLLRDGTGILQLGNHFYANLLKFTEAYPTKEIHDISEKNLQVRLLKSQLEELGKKLK